jgi:hypothetical protein
MNSDLASQWASLGSVLVELQIFGRKSRPFANSGEHPWSDFVRTMKCEHVIRPTIPRKDAVRSSLALD